MKNKLAVNNIPVVLEYSWKGSDWKTLRTYPKLYAEYEMIRLKRLYAYEYDFRIKQ